MPIDPEAEARLERAKRLRSQIADLVSGTDSTQPATPPPPPSEPESNREFIARRMKELAAQKGKGQGGKGKQGPVAGKRKR
jgi:hypothetical protein